MMAMPTAVLPAEEVLSAVAVAEGLVVVTTLVVVVVRVLSRMSVLGIFIRASGLVDLRKLQYYEWTLGEENVLLPFNDCGSGSGV